MNQKRSLLQCFNAKVCGDDIYCCKGHLFGNNKDTISINRLARKEPLEYEVCQDCKDYDEMGGPVSREDRGWIDIIKSAATADISG